MARTDPLLDSVVRIAKDVEPVGEPCSFEILKPPHRKSAVLRVHSRVGRSFIVKRCRMDTGRIEERIYSCVLNRIGQFSPTLLGYQERGGCSWLFLEDVAGEPYSSRSSWHRDAAGAWMARLHEAAVSCVDTVDLPARGLEYWMDLLQRTRRAIATARSNPHWPSDGANVLDRLDRAMDVLESHWSWIADAARDFPVTLVHGGFAGKNVLVDASASSPRIAAFDWEAGGWGLPFADLSRVSLSAYRGALGSTRSYDPSRLDSFAAVGAVLWHIAPIHGEGPALRSKWPSRVAGKLQYYADQVDHQLEALRWNT